MFRKYAKLEVLEVKSAASKLADANLSVFASLGDDYKTEDGYLYVRVRAISSRVNKNNDGWPSEELQKSYRSFIGKPIFVDHHNHDPKRARGVVVDAAVHVEDEQKVSSTDKYYASAPTEHLPPTWVELLLEVDAKKFPKLAKAIIDGDIDGVSMGANVERSKCSHCGNWATNPDEYCNHVRSKGAYFDFKDPDTGQKTSKKAYEDCYDIGFFELSFVFDPADETALLIDKKIAARRMFDIYAEEVGPRTAMARVASTLGPVPEWEDDRPEYGVPEEEEIPGAEVPGVQAPARVGPTDENDAIGWRMEQYIEAGIPPEMAQELATRKDIDWHRIVDTVGQGATPEQAHQIFTHTVSDDEFFGFAKMADGDNPPPQSEMTTAPTEVDTLRQEQVCPICGSDMEDGICEVCNYEEPPEGFNNPDLEKAKETDLREEEAQAEDAQEQQQGQQTPGAPSPGQGQQMGPAGSPGMTQPVQSSTNNREAAAEVTDEEQVSEHTARINTQERPILPVTRKLTDKPKNPKTVKDSKKPVESNRKDTESDMTVATQKTADGASPQGEGVAADKRVDVEGVGAVSGDPLSGIESENVEKDTGDFVAPHTDTWSGEEGDSLPMADAVTSEVPQDLFSVASTDKTSDVDTIEQDSVASGFPDHDPSHVDLEALLAEEVGDRTMTDSTSTAFRSLESAPAVTKDLNGNDVGGPIGVAIAKAQIMKAFKVAEAEVGLGLINADDKFDRVAELEDSNESLLDAQLDTLSKVKTAGLRRPKAEQKIAGRLPALGRGNTAAVAEVIAASEITEQEVEDSIFR